MKKQTPAITDDGLRSCRKILFFLLNALVLSPAFFRAAAQGYSPDEAPKHMSWQPGLQVQLVASEPMIAQPVCIEFDDRGRLWVIQYLQYLQYPNPAGLQRTGVDRWSRTTYDRVPEPPPRGPKGADRITILEDTHGDGRADQAHDFVNGLNLATGLAFGHGGVFVLNVPYLLFYPDRDGDDVADSDPIVCLTGFGMEDAHSVANSLTWGPDGWLYGCQGSTVTARIRGLEFQQGVWRYHPLTHEFELFCEGGGNSWGLDFDDEGELIYSTDGAVYFADWFDQRTAHPDPDAEWDRRNGRVYRISTKGTKPVPAPDMGKFSTPQLIALLGGRNDWLVRKARRLLADRRDPEAIFPLRSLILETPSDHLALEALWALYVSGGFNEGFAAKTLGHRCAAIRKWTVRFLGDEKRMSPELAIKLAELAKNDPDVRVRSQLASSAQRLASTHAWPILEALLLRDTDGRDPYVPLLLWWGVEHHAVSALADLEKFFTSSSAWKSGLVRDVIQERLLRRWIAEGSPATFDASAQLLASAPDAQQQRRLLVALEQGFHDRPAGPVTLGTGGLFAKSEVSEIRTNTTRFRVEQLTPALMAQLNSLWHDDTTDPVLLSVGIRSGRQAAANRIGALLDDATAKPELRLNLIQLLAQLADPSDAHRLLNLIGTAPESLQLAALDALPAFDLPELAQALLQSYTKLGERVRARVRQVWLSRKTWARTILHEVDAGRLPATDFALEQVRMVALHRDKELDDLVRKHWGRLSGGSAEEKLAEMRRLNNDLNAGPGDPARGREIFAKVCGVCHMMYSEGGKVGPDLTEANRADREFLLASIVDPSAAIRKEFLADEVETKDDRVLSGVILDQAGGNLALGISTGERVVIPQTQVALMRESAVSVMPEGLAKPLKPHELRDLFSFLQTEKKRAPKP